MNKNTLLKIFVGSCCVNAVCCALIDKYNKDYFERDTRNQREMAKNNAYLLRSIRRAAEHGNYEAVIDGLKGMEEIENDLYDGFNKILGES